jgi:FkbM family methyltransferase
MGKIKFIRNIIEKLSRNIRIKRRLPKNFGSIPFYISPDSQLRYLKLNKYKAFGEDLLHVIENHVNENSVVWDIGANVGVFTFASAFKAKEVVAIEADLFLASLLNKSQKLKKNRGRNIKILPVAISDEISISKFEIAERGRASNSLAYSSPNSRLTKGGVREVNFVPTFTLDSLLKVFKKPTLIKIDVEGAELKVLKGMEKILKDIRPDLYIEVGSEYVDEITELLVRNNYQLFNESGLSIKKCIFNTIAINTMNS